LGGYWFNFCTVDNTTGGIVCRHCVTSWKFVRSIPDGVIGMESFVDITLPAALWPLG